MQKDELDTVFTENNVDIACITESWLNKSTPSEVISVPGWLPRPPQRSEWWVTWWRGGSSCAARRPLSAAYNIVRLSQLTSSIESVWLLYRQPRMPRTLSHVATGAIYHTPAGEDRIVVAHIVNSLDTIGRDHPQAGIVLI